MTVQIELTGDRPVVYLAGPEVFLPNAREIGYAKEALCAANGMDSRFPLVDMTSLKRAAPADRGHEIYAACVAMMDECDLIIANMTPFRGVSMDVGTAIEMGYMLGQGRPVFAYTNVLADYDARVQHDNLEVESFGFADNLMTEGAVWSSHGNRPEVIVRHAASPADLYTDLDGFKACVEQAATALGLQAG